MKKRRVVIIHNIIVPYIIPLFEILNKTEEYEVKFFFTSENESNKLWEKEVDSKFKYKILPKLAVKIPDKDSFTYFINPTIYAELIKYNPDVIIVAGWDTFSYQVAFVYAKVFRKKFILWAGSTTYEKSWRRTITKPLVKMIVHYSDALLAYGIRSKQYLISLGANPKKIFIAHNTVNIDFFEKETQKLRKEKALIKKEIGIKTPKTILYIGQLIKRKGLECLLDAFKDIKTRINDVSLIMVGDGPLDKDLRSLIKRKKIQDVFFIKGVNWNETAKFYAIADLFVLPSFEDCWGLVVNEAMASGLSLITSDKVGASEDLIKRGKNGYVFTAGSAKSLSHYLKLIIKNTSLANKMGKLSADLIKPFNNIKRAEAFKKSIKYCFNNKHA